MHQAIAERFCMAWCVTVRKGSITIHYLWKKKCNRIDKYSDRGKINIIFEGRVQYERLRLCTSVQQQFHIKNVQKITFTGLLRPFLVLWGHSAYQLRMDWHRLPGSDFTDPYGMQKHEKMWDTAVIPEQFDQYVRYPVGLFFLCAGPCRGNTPPVRRTGRVHTAFRGNVCTWSVCMGW